MRIEHVDGWCQVRFADGREGWVFGAYVYRSWAEERGPAKLLRPIRLPAKAGGRVLPAGETVFVCGLALPAGLFRIQFPDGQTVDVPPAAVRFIQ
jgi:hypothetical protein